MACALFALCLVAALARAQNLPPDMAALADLRLLYARYRCPIEDSLWRLYNDGSPAVERDKFIVVTLHAPRPAYVKCHFHDDKTKLLCEASSGLYDDSPNSPRAALPAEKLAAFGRRGFSTGDVRGTFVRDMDLAKPLNFGREAEAILDALFDGYDARVDTKLDVITPFAPGVTSTCDPVN